MAREIKSVFDMKFKSDFEKYKDIDINQKNKNGLNALIEAVLNEDTDTAKLLLRHGIEIQSFYDYIKIHEEGYISYIELLKKNKQDEKLKSYISTKLYLFLTKHDAELQLLLIEKGLDISPYQIKNIKDVRFDFLLTYESGNVEVLKKLIAAGNPIEIENKSNAYYFLMSDINICSYLYEKGLDINKECLYKGHQRYPLYNCINYNKNFELYISKFKIDVDIENEDGENVLFKKKIFKYNNNILKIFPMLSTPFKPNNEGDIFLYHCEINKKIIDMISQYYPDFNYNIETEKSGIFLIHVLKTQRDADIILEKLLKENLIDLNFKNTTELIFKYSHLLNDKLVELFINYGLSFDILLKDKISLVELKKEIEKNFNIFDKEIKNNPFVKGNKMLLLKIENEELKSSLNCNEELNGNKLKRI